MKYHNDPSTSVEQTHRLNYPAFDYLIQLLQDLEDVEQPRQYHPEGNALFHSLQVFELSLKYCGRPKLWAAALFHDVGKAVDSKHHCSIGREMLTGVLDPDVIWLVEHHLDLLIKPNITKQKYNHHPLLSDLEMLRKCDVAGRDPFARPISVQSAINILAQYADDILSR